MEQAYLLELLVMQNIFEWELTAECLMFFYDELCRKRQYHSYAKVLGFFCTSVGSHSIRRKKYYLLPFVHRFNLLWRTDTNIKMVILKIVRQNYCLPHLSFLSLFFLFFFFKHLPFSVTQLDKIIESDALNSTNRNSTWKYNQHINFEYFLPHEQLIFRKAFPSPKTRTFQNRFIFIQDSGEFKVLVKCGECLYSPMKLNSSPHPPSPCQGTAIQKPPVTFLSKCPDDFETQLCCGYATSDSRPKSVLLWKSTSWCIRGFLIGRAETKAEEKLHAFFLKSGAYMVTTVCCGDSMTRWQHKTVEKQAKEKEAAIELVPKEWDQMITLTPLPIQSLWAYLFIWYISG